MRIGNGANKTRYNEIVLLHLIGAVMILLCHFAQKEHIGALGELFISGVPLFLFISGFLAGIKPIENAGQWLKKRAIRILVPYYLWIVPCMLILWIYDHELVSLKQFLFLLTNMQGLNYVYWKSNLYGAVTGLGHLWFTTEIMLCYALVPLFEKYVTAKPKNTGKWCVFIFVLMAVVQPLAIIVGFQLNYIIIFFLGYVVAKHGCMINNRRFGLLSIACVVITVARLFLMRLIDGSLYYDRYVALLSAAAIGIWVIFFVFWLSYRRKAFVDCLAENKGIQYLSEISFEIYITHFWFLNGKWQVANYIGNKVIADIMVCVLTVVFSALLHAVSQRVIKRLEAQH